MHFRDTSETVSRIAKAKVEDLFKDDYFTMQGWHTGHVQNLRISGTLMRPFWELQNQKLKIDLWMMTLQCKVNIQSTFKIKSKSWRFIYGKSTVQLHRLAWSTCTMATLNSKLRKMCTSYRFSEKYRHAKESEKCILQN